MAALAFDANTANFVLTMKNSIKKTKLFVISSIN